MQLYSAGRHRHRATVPVIARLSCTISHLAQESVWIIPTNPMVFCRVVKSGLQRSSNLVGTAPGKITRNTFLQLILLEFTTSEYIFVLLTVIPKCITPTNVKAKRIYPVVSTIRYEWCDHTIQFNFNYRYLSRSTGIIKKIRSLTTLFTTYIAEMT